MTVTVKNQCTETCPLCHGQLPGASLVGEGDPHQVRARYELCMVWARYLVSRALASSE